MHSVSKSGEHATVLEQIQWRDGLLLAWGPRLDAMGLMAYHWKAVKVALLRTTVPPRTAQPTRSGYEHRETLLAQVPWLHVQGRWVSPRLLVSEDRSPRCPFATAEKQHPWARCLLSAYRRPLPAHRCLSVHRCLGH